MYCSLQDSLIEYISYRQSIKSLRLTVKKAVELNLVDTKDHANALYDHLKNKRPLQEIARLLIFWHYDRFNPVYEDYNYTFYRIIPKDKQERWEKFKKIYPV